VTLWLGAMATPQIILAMTECWVAEVPKEEELQTRDTKEWK